MYYLKRLGLPFLPRMSPFSVCGVEGFHAHLWPAIRKWARARALWTTLTVSQDLGPQSGSPDGRIPACCTVHRCPYFIVLPSVLAQVVPLLAGSISLGFEIQGYSAVSMLVLILLSSLLEG